MIILDELFSSLDASIVFIQEARLPEAGFHSTGNYKMYRAGATERGAGGVQIWIRHFLVNSVASVKVPSPYLIHPTLQFGPYFVHLVSGHAPIEAAPEHEKASYWEAVYKELQPVANDPLHIVLAGIDANARVGSTSCPAVGKYNQQKKTETEDGSEQSPPNALSF
ncbi:MAG: endonuclease/exonuclease/phosphatase family protein [Planctomycetes bacterium]|nr:endonuclease/exonuclease/phosphatase family protein [Planctomycetota bacterium]